MIIMMYMQILKQNESVLASLKPTSMRLFEDQPVASSARKYVRRVSPVGQHLVIGLKVATLKTNVQPSSQ
jgi:hypothetical protein